MRPTARDEEGFAMITAILVSFVVLLLAMAVFQLSLHNTMQGGYDRKRVESIAAAEAGIDYYYSYLQSTGSSAPACSVTKSLTATPTSSFSVTATFYDAANAVIACTGSPPSLPPNVTPASVLIRSAGQSSAASPTRTMESYSYLSLNTAATFNNAYTILANNSITFTANATIGGMQYSDANLWSNGNITMAANSTISGSLTALGTITLQSGSDVEKNVTAGGALTLQSRAIVRGDATSSTSSITLGNNAHVYGNARAGTTITGGTIDGYQTPNSPTPVPSMQSYPAYSYNATSWTSAGYTVRGPYADCSTLLSGASSLANWWGAAAGTSQLVRVTGNCTIPSNVTINVPGNLAFIVDGSMTLGTNARFALSGTGPYNVYFFAGLADQTGCNFTANSNAGLGSGLSGLIYVPASPVSCSVNVQSNSIFTQGQVLGGSVNFSHTANFQFMRPTVPGTGVGGFKEDVKCLREVVNNSPLPAAPAC